MPPSNSETRSITVQTPWQPDGWRRWLASPFAVNLSAVAAARVVTIAAGLVTLGYAARILGPELYGTWAFATAVVAYASILLSPGLATWGTRAIAQDRQNAGRTLLVVNLAQLALATVAYGGVAAFAMWAVSDPVEQKVLLLAGLVLVANALNIEWVFAGLEQMRVNAAISAAVTVATAASLLTLIHTPGDIYLFAGFPAIFGSLGFLAGCVVLARSGVRLHWPGTSAFGRALASSLPLGIAMALVVVLHHANKLIVYAFLGTEAVGMFAAAFRLVTLAGMFPAMLSSVFLPRLARIAKDHDERAGEEAMLFARVHLFVAFLIAAVMAAEAPVVVGTIFGPAYGDAVPLVRIFSVAVVFNFAICGYTNCLISYGQDRVMLLVVIVSLVVAVGGGLIAVPLLGTLGAAIVIAGVDLAGWLASLPTYRRVVGCRHFGAWIAPLAGCLLFVAAALWLQWMAVSPWIRLPLCIGIYAICIRSSLKTTLAATCKA